jgi:hypothetical protein
MKRTYRDGQYTVVRKSSWLLHVTIEGPLGDRAGNGFLLWLSNLPALYTETQYVLLDVTNIGPVAENLLDQLVKTTEVNDIGALSVLGGQNAAVNMAPLIEKSQQSEKIAYFSDMPSAHRFPQQLYDNAQTSPVEAVSEETLSEKQNESSPPRS